jgi:DNA-damage-inducible protein J
MPAARKEISGGGTGKRTTIRAEKHVVTKGKTLAPGQVVTKGKILAPGRTEIVKEKAAASGKVTVHQHQIDDASMLHVRIAGNLKARATKTLAGIGFTTSEAVRLFLHRVVVEQRLPLDLHVPNAETEAAILEAREIAGRPSRFKNAEEMFESLEKAG